MTGQVSGTARSTSRWLIAGSIAAVILVVAFMAYRFWNQNDFTAERTISDAATTELILVIPEIIVLNPRDEANWFVDGDAAEKVGAIYLRLLDETETVDWVRVGEFAFADVPEADRSILMEAFESRPDRLFFEDNDTSRRDDDFEKRLAAESRADLFRSLVALAAWVHIDAGIGTSYADAMRELAPEFETQPEILLEVLVDRSFATGVKVAAAAIEIETILAHS